MFTSRRRRDAHAQPAGSVGVVRGATAGSLVDGLPLEGAQPDEGVSGHARTAIAYPGWRDSADPVVGERVALERVGTVSGLRAVL